MEQKLARVPFDMELAKKITNKEMEGRIITRGGRSVRIVCFDAKTNCYPIVAMMTDVNGEEIVITRTIDGKIVPSATDTDRDSLMLEIPECLTFKDGDVLRAYDYIVIIKNPRHDKEDGFCFQQYAAYDCDRNKLVKCVAYGIQKKVRFATEEEKQKLIDALKASEEPKAKEYLKRFFGIEEKPKYEFKPFDKVLVRDDEDEMWRIDLFSHTIETGEYVCLEYAWKQCIPYNEQTVHLLGTADDWEE